MLVLLGLGFPSSGASRCKRKPIIFNFGDSNSDTDGFSVALRINFALPDGRTLFHEATGWLCDGRLTIDFLCESLNTSYLDPYLGSLGPNFSNDANFAVAGSATLPRLQPFSLDVQVCQFLLFQSRSPLLLSRGHANLVGEDGFTDALYIIDIGQNDLATQFTTLSYSQFVGNISVFIEGIRLAISVEHIYQVGGKNFWVHNIGPFGRLPNILVTSPHTQSDIDELGCLRSRNNAAREFNRQLRSLCEDLRPQMKNAMIVYVDIFAIKYDLIANHAKHGFENSLMVCCGNVELPYNYNTNVTCSRSGFTVCVSRRVSWDDVRSVEAANSFVVSRILSANYFTPPVTFNFFYNV